MKKQKKYHFSCCYNKRDTLRFAYVNNHGMQVFMSKDPKGPWLHKPMKGSDFLIVVGIGISGDVRLMKDESEGSLFQWQDMLHNQCMLLAIKTNRYVGLTPETGEPYAADRTGTLPGKKDGTVFAWEITGK
jgi:hypothetical protein